MRFKQFCALCGAAIYIMSAGAAAAEVTVQQPVSVAAEAAGEAMDPGLLSEAPPVARALKVAPSAHKVKVNGKAVRPQVYNIDGNNYFKLRDVAYLLNGTTSTFNVVWDSAKNAVDLRSGQKYVAVGDEMTVAAAAPLKVQASTARVLLDGSGIVIKGYNINGNNYYKIADVSAALGFTAAYDKATTTVHINTPAAPDPDPEQGDGQTPEPPDENFVTGVYRVKVDSSLSIRSGPGKDYAVIGSLRNGEEIVVDGISAGWAHLKEQGIASRYCSADYLIRVRDYDADTPTPEPEPTPQPEPAPEEFTPGVYQVKASDWLSVRSGPGRTYTLVGRLLGGAEVVVVDITDGWAQILSEDGAQKRYCSADYLTRLRDYDVDDEIPEDPVKPPRTSHLDGRMTVILDAGHGGSDIGAHNEDQSLDEKHVNLYVAQYLREYLQQAGMRVIMVRETMEEGSSLSLRKTVMERYAASADLFFSVHHNAANTVARGAEVLAQISDKNGGPTKILGEALLREYEKLGVPIRSVVFRAGSSGSDYYYTNRAAAALQIPALTSEFCFIDNVEDQLFIDSDEDLQREARAQADAIRYYFTQVDY